MHSLAGYELQRNRCFELASTRALDGLVVLSLSTTASVMKDFLDSYQGIPICSVGIAVPGYALVQADNAAGMRDAVLHLITVHNCRKIGFLRGPTDNLEADTRFRAYCDAPWRVSVSRTRPSASSTPTSTMSRGAWPWPSCSIAVSSSTPWLVPTTARP